MNWRFLPERWRAAATIRSMKGQQTVLVVTIRDGDERRRARVAARLRAVLHHPTAQGLVTYTEETFPQAPQVDDGDDEDQADEVEEQG